MPRYGFKRYRASGVTLMVDQNLRADITLEIGQLTESVQSSNALLVDTRSSEKSATIDDQRIVDLLSAAATCFHLPKRCRASWRQCAG